MGGRHRGGFRSHRAGNAPPPYKGQARALFPAATEIGFEQASAPRSVSGGATVSYTSAQRGSASITVSVFKTPAASLTSYRARCGGCETMIYPQGWRLKRSFTATADYRHEPQTLRIDGICSNVIVTVQVANTRTKDSLSSLALWIANKAFEEGGLSPCRAEQAIPTKKVYWSPSQAEKAATTKLVIPYCMAHPDDSGCARFSGIHPAEASCTGADELGSSRASRIGGRRRDPSSRARETS